GAPVALTLSGRMTASLLALSLSNTFTQIGAIAAFAALIAIAILSLLSFSQAREIRRLREWAGRAPERAAELEQRVTAAASARLQQPRVGEMGRPGERAAPLGARGAAPAGAPTVASGPTAPAAVPA